MAGCATPTGSAGHASATTDPKLTFNLGHSMGADQFFGARLDPSTNAFASSAIVESGHNHLTTAVTCRLPVRLRPSGDRQGCVKSAPLQAQAFAKKTTLMTRFR